MSVPFENRPDDGRTGSACLRHAWHADRCITLTFTQSAPARAEPALTVGGIRADLLNRGKNGLAESGAVIRRGRLLLLHRERYMSWLLDHGREAA